MSKTLEVPNGKLIRTNNPCDECGGRRRMSIGAERTKKYGLFTYNGKEICMDCGMKCRLLGLK